MAKLIKKCMRLCLAMVAVPFMVVNALQFGLSGKSTASIGTIPPPLEIPTTSHDTLPDVVDMSISSSSSRPMTRTRRSNASITIRATNKADLPSIIDLLAYEGTSTPNTSANINRRNTIANGSAGIGRGGGLLKTNLNWNAGIQMLKRKQSLKAQLTPRMDACATAAQTLSRFFANEHNANDEDPSLHPHQVLWGNESFRNKVQKAVHQTQEYNVEGTAWDSHNFALTPEPWMLQHFLLTAFDREFVGGNKNSDEEVAGFCEVGMLPNPLYDGDSDGDDSGRSTMREFIPCIGNLVVSPNQRRRGIAGRLVQSSVRIVKLHGGQDRWSEASTISKCTNMIGLWVEEHNSPAIRLYQKHGFQMVRHTMSKKEGRVFMYLNIDPCTNIKESTNNKAVKGQLSEETRSQ